jgi:hypothetical protein
MASGGIQIECDDDHAAARERFVDRRIVHTIHQAPGTAMDFDHNREWPGAARLVQTREQRLVVAPQLFDVGNVDLVAIVCACSHDAMLLRGCV